MTTARRSPPRRSPLHPPTNRLRRQSPPSRQLRPDPRGQATRWRSRPSSSSAASRSTSTGKQACRQTTRSSSGDPQLEELTGIKINTIELDHGDLFTKAIAESIAGSGAYDILNIEPAWVPDLVAGNVIAPLDDWVAQYMPPADLEDYAPLYQTMATWQGQRYGLFDDGDVLILYYRKDIFDDLGLAVPATWDEFVATAETINARGRWR